MVTPAEYKTRTQHWSEWSRAFVKNVIRHNKKLGNEASGYSFFWTSARSNEHQTRADDHDMSQLCSRALTGDAIMARETKRRVGGLHEGATARADPSHPTGDTPARPQRQRAQWYTNRPERRWDRESWHTRADQQRGRRDENSSWGTGFKSRTHMRLSSVNLWSTLSTADSFFWVDPWSRCVGAAKCGKMADGL